MALPSLWVLRSRELRCMPRETNRLPRASCPIRLDLMGPTAIRGRGRGPILLRHVGAAESSDGERRDRPWDGLPAVGHKWPRLCERGEVYFASFPCRCVVCALSNSRPSSFLPVPSSFYPPALSSLPSSFLCLDSISCFAFVVLRRHPPQARRGMPWHPLALPPFHRQVAPRIGIGLRIQTPARSPTSRGTSRLLPLRWSGFLPLRRRGRQHLAPRWRNGWSESKQQHSSVSSTKAKVTVGEDPFVVLESTPAKAHSASGLSTEPLEHINKPSESLKSDGSSAQAGLLFDDINVFDGFMKSVPSLPSDIKDNKDRSPLETTGKASVAEPSTKSFDNLFPRTVPDDKSHQTMFEKPSKSSESFQSVHMNGLNFDANVGPYDANSAVNATRNPEEQHVMDDDLWLTVSEIPLFTQPTSAPPPSRPPPPPAFRSKQAPFASNSKVYSGGMNTIRKVSESSFPHPNESYHFHSSHNDVPIRSDVSSIDELEEFGMGKLHGYVNEAQPGEEENGVNSTAAASAAAMKQTMDRAEAKFKHAREVRERERDLKSSKNKETPQHVIDEDEKEKERLDHEREQREREKEQRRLEKMRELELEREREREREKARLAVERANREARERAAAEARQKAEKIAREQAERAAVQRAQAEARERAAAAARERAEKLAAERERAARERAAERERAEAEARERTARERAAAMARQKQEKNENDLSSFFGMGVRATSAPKERAAPSGSAFDTQFQNKMQTSSVSTSSMKRPSSTTNIMDDLTSVFGTSSKDEFQEIEGEPEERRRARLEREQRAHERAVKALAEKNEREMQMQNEQAERDRISDTLNIEIRRWAAGKEGNLRALLSTLQYVLWPDSGWQPVSLTDLILAVSVKKVYRKATLCVHPDKVVNGTVQQKYIAEKVFDLLKEAWNKFNSEELF